MQCTTAIAVGWSSPSQRGSTTAGTVGRYSVPGEFQREGGREGRGGERERERERGREGGGGGGGGEGEGVKSDVCRGRAGKWWPLMTPLHILQMQ